MTLVAKNKNCEGGMGIHFFKNAAFGGDWILQAKLENSAELAQLLPEPAPLSTLRVLTASSRNSSDEDRIVPLTCVFRAGRKDAATDHRAVCYNVDIKSWSRGGGSASSFRISYGAANSHWYLVGVRKTLRYCFGDASLQQKTISVHPDTGRNLIGVVLPGVGSALELCVRAHDELCRDVPLVGWDVAIVDGPSDQRDVLSTQLDNRLVEGPTIDKGIRKNTPDADFGSRRKKSDCRKNDNRAAVAENLPVLLEANLSCNFFLGEFDKERWLDFVHDYIMELERRMPDGGGPSFPSGKKD